MLGLRRTPMLLLCVFLTVLGSRASWVRSMTDVVPKTASRSLLQVGEWQCMPYQGALAEPAFIAVRLDANADVECFGLGRGACLVFGTTGQCDGTTRSITQGISPVNCAQLTPPGYGQRGHWCEMARTALKSAVNVPNYHCVNWPEGGRARWVAVTQIGGDAACLALNGKDCIVHLTEVGCLTEVIRMGPRWQLQPLVCGAAHQEAWGATGYTVATHWCATARILFNRNPVPFRCMLWWAPEGASPQYIAVRPSSPSNLECLGFDGRSCSTFATRYGCHAEAQAVVTGRLTPVPVVCGGAMNGNPEHWCALGKVFLAGATPLPAGNPDPITTYVIAPPEVPTGIAPVPPPNATIPLPFSKDTVIPLPVEPTPVPPVAETKTTVPTPAPTPVPPVAETKTTVPTPAPTPVPPVAETKTAVPTPTPTPVPPVAETKTAVPTPTPTPVPPVAETKTTVPTPAPTPVPPVAETKTAVPAPTPTETDSELDTADSTTITQGPWQCLPYIASWARPGSYLAARVGATTGEVQCLSLDAAICIVYTNKGLCEAAVAPPLDPARVINPLNCGADHAAVWVGDGYSLGGHWCQLYRDTTVNGLKAEYDAAAPIRAQLAAAAAVATTGAV